VWKNVNEEREYIINFFSEVCQLSFIHWVRPKKVARLSGLEGVVKQAPTVAK
jgi:hypothetical protein